LDSDDVLPRVLLAARVARERFMNNGKGNLTFTILYPLRCPPEPNDRAVI
jgi:hypothetical protein